MMRLLSIPLKKLNETFVRSINTSFTVFITLMALYILGGESTHFSFILVVGLSLERIHLSF